MRGPATTPSFVTWPTINIDTCRLLASFIRTLVASLTCPGLPGACPASSLYIVCIESIITMPGFISVIADETAKRSVSHNMYRLLSKLPSLSALIFICLGDSSPDTYSILCPSADNFLHICRRRVDLPMPGSPPTSTSEPATMPPPRTLSSSPMPVAVLSSSPALTSLSLAGTLRAIPGRAPFTLSGRYFAAGGASVNESHSWHTGHWPSHFGDS